MRFTAIRALCFNVQAWEKLYQEKTSYKDLLYTMHDKELFHQRFYEKSLGGVFWKWNERSGTTSEENVSDMAGEWSWRHSGKSAILIRRSGYLKQRSGYFLNVYSSVCFISFTTKEINPFFTRIFFCNVPAILTWKSWNSLQLIQRKKRNQASWCQLTKKNN